MPLVKWTQIGHAAIRFPQITETGKRYGGGRGIRTPGTLSSSTVFKTAGFNHSPIPPFIILSDSFILRTMSQCRFRLFCLSGHDCHRFQLTLKRVHGALRLSGFSLDSIRNRRPPVVLKQQRVESARWVRPSHVWGDHLSGNSPGIQRDARIAGKERRSGARGLSDVSTSFSSRAETIRLP